MNQVQAMFLVIALFWSGRLLALRICKATSVAVIHAKLNDDPDYARIAATGDINLAEVAHHRWVDHCINALVMALIFWVLFAVSYFLEHSNV